MACNDYMLIIKNISDRIIIDLKQNILSICL
jgi:hypothetical protein